MNVYLFTITDRLKNLNLNLFFDLYILIYTTNDPDYKYEILRLCHEVF